MKLGLEMECWVVDESGALCDGHDLVDAHDRIEAEFVGSLVEVRTEAHHHGNGVEADLRETLRIAIDAAARRGKRLVPLGTPLTDATAPATNERGRLFEDIYGDGIASAKNCAGTHVHFEKGEICRQLTLLTALDPALALVSSSPYYRGRREKNCSRAYAYRTQCGEAFRAYCDLLSYTDSVDEWEARVDDSFEEYVSLAADRGVAESTVREHFCPEDTVLNPVRLRHEQPTVEWRAPDAALPSQVVDLAMDVLDLVASTAEKPIERGPVGVHDDRITVPEFDRLREISWEAIESGLGSERVREYLRRLGFDPSSYDPISRQLDGPEEIGEAEAREIRLEYARRLVDDVASLAGAPDARVGQRVESDLGG